MNAIITRYKKVVLSAMMLAGTGTSAQEVAKCSPCQAAAAARQSARDAAIQAALLAGKPNSREMELDALDPAEMSSIKALAAAVAIAKRMEWDTRNTQEFSRAPRACTDPCSPCNPCGGSDVNLSTLTGLLQGLIASEAVCWATINNKLDAQGKSAAKCCKKIKHELEEIEDLVESQVDQSIACCSVMEANIASLTDQSAACCSVMELQISNLSLSVADVFVLLQSVLDCTCDD